MITEVKHTSLHWRAASQQQLSREEDQCSPDVWQCIRTQAQRASGLFMAQQLGRQSAPMALYS